MARLGKTEEFPMTTSIASKPKRLLPDDILAAILATSELEQFRSHNIELQSVLCDLTSKHQDLLAKYFVFSDASPKPYSPALGDAISRLQLSGLIGRVNPDYKVILVKAAAKRYYEEIVKPNLTPNQVDELAQVGREFRDLIAANDNVAATA
jgi:hypothetical protein